MVEYPQCVIDFTSQSPLPFKYNQLDASGKIFCKVDWVTIIFTDVCFNDVLRWLKLSDCVSEFLLNCYEVSRGYSDIVRFLYNGITLETSRFGVYGDQPEVVFDVVVPKLRLEISGSGLDFLRSINVNFDTYRLDHPPRLPEGATYHYSRIDFAYDFIDYCPEFLDKLIEHCNTHQLPSGRVPLASTHGAIKCKIVTGDRKVCYLGSEQSDRFLRVYDKRLQSINRVNGTYVKENPYNNPDSWIRLEWQLRNVKANGAATDPNHDFKTILKQVFESYSMADGERDSHTLKRASVDFWNDLFPWREVESRIIQNKSFVDIQSPDDRLINSVQNTMMRSFLLFATLLSRREEFERLANQFLDRLYENNDVSRRRLISFNCKLNTLSCASKIPKAFSPYVFGLYLDHNRFRFKL